MVRILLLGGTGAIGTYVVDKLLNTENKVYVTSRKPRHNYNNINYILGNAKDEKFLKNLVSKNFDCIVDFMLWEPEQFSRIYSFLLEHTSHYIFLSSYRVYANRDMVPLDENSPLLLDVCKNKEYLKTNEYALAKAREERILAQSNYKNYTIIRPSITFSKTRFQIGTYEASVIIPRSLRNKQIIVTNELLTKRAAISWAGDVSDMILFLIGNEKAKREIYNTATSESNTWQTICGYYHDIIGTNYFIADTKSFFRVARRTYQIKYDRFYNRVINNDKIIKLMGVSQKKMTPIKEALCFELSNIKKNIFSIKEDFKMSKLMDDIISHKYIRN